MHVVNQYFIEACLKCVFECERCASECVAQSDATSRQKCIQLCLDLAQLCLLTIQFTTRGSANTKTLCTLCSQVSDSCAVECNRYGDKHCIRCAEVCQEFAEECRKMVVYFRQ